MSTHILIVDDEPTTRQVLCEAFTQLGYQAAGADSGEQALATMSQTHYDVVILDLEMPGKGGIAVLQEAETVATNTDFVILTAHASVDTAIHALRFGVFDYLVKPTPLLSIIETVKRVLERRHQQEEQAAALRLLEQAVSSLRTTTPMPATQPSQSALSKQQQPILVGNPSTAGLVINEQLQTITYHDQPLTITPIEYKLLHKFVQQPNTVLSYTDLALASHDVDLDEVEARSLLRTHLYRLSRKLGDTDTTPLQSIRGRGYVLYTSPPPYTDT